jgi:hypothetical protein
VGSIPIARSINLVDSVALTPGNHLKFPFKESILFQRCSNLLQLLQRFWGFIERGGSVPTKEQLENRVRELEEENDSLQDQLDQIFDIVAPPEEKGEDGKDGRDGLRKTGSARVRRNLR